MAHHKSAIKRIRQSESARVRNRLHRVSMRTAIKSLRSAIDAGDLESAEAKLREVTAKIDHTRGAGVIHANTASRKISRLTRAVNKLRAAN